MSLLELYLKPRLTHFGYSSITPVLIVKDDDVYIGMRGNMQEVSSIVCERFLQHNPSGEGKYGQLRDQYKANLMNDLLSCNSPDNKINVTVLHLEDGNGIPNVYVIHEFNPIEDYEDHVLKTRNKKPTALELSRIKASVELINSYLSWLITDLEVIQTALQDEVRQLYRSYGGRTEGKVLWSFETRNYLVRVFAVPVDLQETSKKIRHYSQLHLEEQAIGNGELFTLKASVIKVWNQAETLGFAEHINYFFPRPSSINALTRLNINQDVNAVALKAIQKARFRLNDKAI